LCLVVPNQNSKTIIDFDVSKFDHGLIVLANVETSKIGSVNNITDSHLLLLNGSQDFIKFGYLHNTANLYMLINVAYDQLIA
jgi:hypothetical protein